MFRLRLGSECVIESTRTSNLHFVGIEERADPGAYSRIF